MFVRLSTSTSIIIAFVAIVASDVMGDTPRTFDTQAMFSPAFSPDGKLLANSGDRLIQIWEVESGRVLRTLSGHTDLCHAVVFTPDGRRLVSGGKDGKVKLWDVATGREEASLDVESGVDALDVSPDRTTAAVAVMDKSVVLIDLKSMSVRTRLHGHTGRIKDLAFSPDGKRLVSAGDIQDKTVRLWDTAAGRQLAEFREHGSEVLGLDFSPDGKQFISVGTDGLRLWDAVTPRHLKRLYEERYLFTTGVRWSPDGKTLAMSRKNDIVLFDAGTGQELRQLRGHTVNVVGLAFSPDGARLASTGYDSKLRIWEVGPARQDEHAYARVGSEAATLEGHRSHVTSLAFSPNGKQLVSSDGEGKLIVWDVATRKPAVAIPAADLPVGKVEFSPDGKGLVFLSPYGKFTYWDLQTNRAAAEVEMEASSPNDFEFMPGRRFVAATHMFGALILNVRSGEVVRRLKGHSDQVRGLEWLADGKTLASGSHDGTVRLWDVSTGTVKQTFKIPEGAIQAIDLSPDGKSVVAVGNGLVAWDVATGEKRYGVEGLTLYAYDVAFSPDGKLIAAGGGRQKVWLFDAKSGKELAKLKGHTDGIFAVAFSPDGKTLASGGADETVKLWDLTAIGPASNVAVMEETNEPSSDTPAAPAEGGGEFRTWTDKTGRFKIEAKLLAYRAGRARLEKRDGSTVWLGLSQLSDEDRKFVLEQGKQPAATGDDKAPSGAASAPSGASKDKDHPVLGYKLGKHPDDAVAFGGHWYKLISGKVKWTEAQEKCKEMGGYLACITSRGENDFIVKLRPEGHLWLGGIRGDEGRWVWITGELMKSANWQPGEPNNAGNSEFFMKNGPRGTWYDVPSLDGNIWGFVCEWEM